MSTLDLDPSNIIMVMDFGFGPEATTFSHSSVSLCAPCLEHDERHRRASWTGVRDMDFSAPNLCPTHRQAYDAGREWNRSLGDAGRPRLESECLVDSCDGVPRGKGLCQKHYSQARRRAQKLTDTTSHEFALPL